MHEALEQYIKALNTCDFAELKKCLREESVFYFTDRICVGVEEIRSYCEEGWAAIEDEKYWADDVSYILQTEDVLVCTYKFNYAGYVNAKHVMGNVKATNVFAREGMGGPWKLLHEHLSRTDNRESIY